jgi:uncharacterized protein
MLDDLASSSCRMMTRFMRGSCAVSRGRHPRRKDDNRVNVRQAQPEARPESTATVASPCIAVCRLDPRTRACEGCGRTAREIARWAYAEDAEKRDILAEVARRRSSEA